MDKFMSTEKTGEQVFTNIDKVLAEKIISRSKENSKESEPAPKQSVNKNHTAEPQSSVSRKWLMIAAGCVLLIVLMSLRKGSKNA
jgi:type VI protein secretion system component VasF